ncbi:MAG: thioredoxin fold domain-containing protein, partial [Thiotrichaceae bacterium]|nr:thioredoxin fold domain-containing protein [Thiotrichaceae bacterium]
CSKFHNEVAKLNEAGVKVRYFSFPRAGVGSSTYNKMVSVWCSKDQQQAMTDAKERRNVKAATCKNPITKQYELGQRIGITGTPALVLSDGTLVPGYVPAAKLIPYLQKASLPFSGR